jgi:hypothetical protein
MEPQAESAEAADQGYTQDDQNQLVTELQARLTPVVVEVVVYTDLLIGQDQAVQASLLLDIETCDRCRSLSLQ